MKEIIGAVLEFLGEAEEIRPQIQKTVTALKSYGPELDDLIGPMSDWIIKKRIDHIKMVEAAGFSREDAITITMSEWQRVQHRLTRIKK